MTYKTKTNESSIVRRLASACLAVAFLTVALRAFGVAYVTNDVYTVTSYSATNAHFGTIYRKGWSI